MFGVLPPFTSARTPTFGATDADTRYNAHQQFLATTFLLNADPRRYGTLVYELRNQYASGENRFPLTPLEAYKLLNAREKNDADRSRLTNPRRRPPPPGSSDADAKTKTPPANPSNENPRHHQYFMPRHLSFLTHNPLPGTTILLDTGATDSLFNNPALLSTIHPKQPPLTLHTNGGPHIATQQGVYHGLTIPIPVWYNPKSLANILALCDVAQHLRITMDTSTELAIHVHLPTGHLIRFTQLDCGLYAYQPHQPNTTKVRVNAYSCLQSVSTHRAQFTRRELQGADRALDLYRRLGRPSQTLFINALRDNHILNSPVTADDASRAFHIYGPDIAFLKGTRTDRPPAPHVPTFIPQPLPTFITAHHREVTLCVDYFYTQRQGFLHIIDRKFHYRHSFPIRDRSRATMLKHLPQVIQTYTNRGLNVRDVHADREFECIRHDIAPIALHVTTTNTHVGEIERSIRTMKERMRTTAHGMPYTRLPRVMVKELVTQATDLLNRFPSGRGLTREHSPAAIITGAAKPDYNHFQLEFGAYVQLYDNTTNTMKSRTFGAIALHSTGNADGSYAFMSLVTGERVTRAPGFWTELPITDLAIARVHAIAKAEGQPPLQEKNLLVEWRPDQPLDEDAYDHDYAPSPPEQDDGDTLPSDIFEPIDGAEIQALTAEDFGALTPAAPALDTGNESGATDNNEPGASPATHADQHEELTAQGVDNGTHGVATHTDSPTPNDESVFSDTASDGAAADQPGLVLDNAHDSQQAHHPDTVDANDVVDANDTDAGEQPENDPLPDEPGTRYNLRPSRNRDYSHRLAQSMDSPTNRQAYEPPSNTQLFLASPQATDNAPVPEERQDMFRHVLLNQMSARVGYKRFGNVAREATRKEFKQLVDKDVFTPVHASTITQQERQQSLRAVNLIKEKRDGTIKGRTCADGRKQRHLYDRSDTASPTVSADALFLTVIVDAIENRDVATADIVGAYLHAPMDDFVLMRLTGEDVTLMTQVEPSFLPFVNIEGNARVLYLRLNKALYGCVKSALLWYNLFYTTLQQHGFHLNPYDPCVANATFNDRQCTITWYVDDTKISHVDPNVVTKVIKDIEGHFGTMKVTRGKVHEFLGMHIDYTMPGSATITMKSYLKEAIRDSKLDITRCAATPATRHLFTVDPSSTRLETRDADAFRSVVCKLLYVALRGRPDILTTVCFLATRVSRPVEQDERKLRRLLEYINGTIDLALVLGATNLGTLHTWVDASYATHPDMRSHTGGLLSFGTGTIMCRSSKQKLNTKSSTEAELVGASDYLPNTIWAMNFLRHQGHTVRDSFLHQDNQSAMKLAQNGRISAGQKSRHIHIRHFWITDRLRSDRIRLQYCPTDTMLADFLTKPLQGALFVRFRKVLLGHAPIDSLLSPTSPALSQERVEECVEPVQFEADSSDVADDVDDRDKRSVL